MDWYNQQVFMAEMELAFRGFYERFDRWETDVSASVSILEGKRWKTQSAN